MKKSYQSPTKKFTDIPSRKFWFASKDLKSGLRAEIYKDTWTLKFNFEVFDNDLYVGTGATKYFDTEIECYQYFTERVNMYKSISTAKILYLPIKRKWFEMILRGSKKEEYRSCDSKRIKSMLTGNDSNGEYFKQFDYVCFTNGYNPKINGQMLVEFKGSGVGFGETEWGAEKNKLHFIIDLGEVVLTRNCNWYFMEL